MRKIFVLAAILVTSLAVVYFSSCNNETKEPEPTTNKDSLDQVIKRGEYLTLHVAMCLGCHSKRDFSKYSGPVEPGSEGGGGEEFGQKLVCRVWYMPAILLPMQKQVSAHGQTMKY
jgi:mono/diheme cytochrome c family protein